MRAFIVGLAVAAEVSAFARSSGPVRSTPIVLCEIEGDGTVSSPSELAAQLVADAAMIVRVRVAPDTTRAATSGRVRATVLEVLKSPASLIVPPIVTMNGTIVRHDDYNSLSVPYAQVRRAGLRGTCFADEYRAGEQYLLLLKRNDQGAWSPYWAPLQPTTEQIRGPDDPWLVWVREHVATPKRRSP